MYKSYKIRLYPTKEQEILMWKHIGACRFIWNYMLDLQEKRYEEGEKHLSRFDMMNLLPILKRQEGYLWLQDICARSLQVICTNLSFAYNRYYKKISDLPKYKSRKRNKMIFPVFIKSKKFEKGYAHIEKIGKIKYKTKMNLSFNNKIIHPTILNQNGKWILSFLIECENQTPVLTDKPMGIDLGIKETMTIAYGDECIVFHNINKSKRVRKLKNNLRHLHRSISRKYEANRQGNNFIKTNNIKRLENRLRKMYARLANIRNDYNHQCTHKLISLLPNKVVMETLNIKGLLKNKHISSAIKEQCFFDIIKQLKYKCEWNNIPFYQADRFYPSSKACSCCGCIKHNLKLSDRTYVCKECGLVIDRDFNAAINLQRYST